MTTSLTEDDLGARLRAALQEISPLATDPVPPPRFAPDAELATPVAEVPSRTTAGVSADVVVLGVGAGRGPRRARQRVAVAAGVLAAAAVAAGVLVVTTDPGRGATTSVDPGESTAVSAVPTEPTAPPTGPGDGLFVYPEVVRCEAPSGAILSALHVTSPDHLDIWTISPGATCRAMPLERGRYLFDPPRARDVADTPAHIEGSSACLMASTRATTGPTSFVSRGSGDYLEFFGPSCLIRSGSR